jgi:hypothetical protein
MLEVFGFMNISWGLNACCGLNKQSISNHGALKIKYQRLLTSPTNNTHH